MDQQRADELRWLILETSSDGVKEWIEIISQAFRGLQVITVHRKVLAMAVARDSEQGSPFCLGEVLMVECEIVVDGRRFIGRALGDEVHRGQAMALLEAALEINHGALEKATGLLDEERARLKNLRESWSRALGSTRVDFHTISVP